MSVNQASLAYPQLYMPTASTMSAAPVQNQNASIYTTKAENVDLNAKDGKDDGKIGFGNAIGSFFKGIVKPITSMFESPGNFIKGALGIAAGVALVAVTGGAAAPFLVAAGAGFGAVTLGKGVINATTATTDAQAEAAFEDIGTGTFAVGSSLVAAKGIQTKAGTSTGNVAKDLWNTIKPSSLKDAGVASWTNAKTKFGITSRPAPTQTPVDTPEPPPAQALKEGVNTNGNKGVLYEDHYVTVDKNGTIINKNIDLDGSFEVNRYGTRQMYTKADVQTQALSTIDDAATNTGNTNALNTKTTAKALGAADDAVSHTGTPRTIYDIDNMTDAQRTSFMKAQIQELANKLGSVDKAYKQLAKEYHPNAYPANQADLYHNSGASLNEAYELLKGKPQQVNLSAAPKTNPTTTAQPQAPAPTVTKPTNADYGLSQNGYKRLQNSMNASLARGRQFQIRDIANNTKGSYSKGEVQMAIDFCKANDIAL